MSLPRCKFLQFLKCLGIAGFLALCGANTCIAATAEQKIALVIGNSAYPSAALKNPVNDAKAMAAKLTSLGFDVILRTDSNFRDMTRAVSQFGQKLKGGSVGLFYFAGHGMQVRGKNFLIPTDAEIENEASTRSEALDVDQVLEQLGSARLSMVILDACRNNPFERRFRSAGNGGLAQIDAPTGTMLAYATAPGKVAYDGTGANGLYTTELLKALDTPGLKVEDVFKQVRINVLKASDNQQIPWESSSLTGEFYFKPDFKPQGADISALALAKERAELQKSLEDERLRRELDAKVQADLQRSLEEERRKRDKDSELVRVEMEKLRAELLKLTSGVSATSLSAKTTVTPDKAETPAAPTQIAVSRPETNTPKQAAPAAPVEITKITPTVPANSSGSPEWAARIALLEGTKDQLGFAKAFAILLNITDSAALESLIRLEKQLNDLAWSNALAFGLDDSGAPTWSYGGRFSNLSGAITEVNEICSNNARRSCKIILANREFRRKEFFELVEQFKSVEPTTLRQAFMTRLTQPLDTVEVLNGQAGYSTHAARNSKIFSAR